MKYDLKKIEYLHDYIYRVFFEDGTSGEVDFSNVVDSVKPYQFLLNLDLFKKAYVHPELKTLTWADNLDYDPIIKSVFVCGNAFILYFCKILKY